MHPTIEQACKMHELLSAYSMTEEALTYFFQCRTWERWTESRSLSLSNPLTKQTNGIVS